MKIDWSALGAVAAVSLVATLVVVAITSFGIAALTNADERGKQDQPATALRAAAYLCFTLAGLAVLYGIYLIVPVFR